MNSRMVNFYMKVAENVGNLSHAERKKVGAILVKDSRILSLGYNGMPSGMDNTCEEWSLSQNSLVTKAEVQHAELNCLAKVCKSTESSEGGWMFITLSPCLQCTLLIKQCGIETVIYKEAYRDTKGIDFLNQNGVLCISQHDYTHG